MKNEFGTNLKIKMIKKVFGFKMNYFFGFKMVHCKQDVKKWGKKRTCLIIVGEGEFLFFTVFPTTAFLLG